jgi:uncharacterized surface protein with fasciclin (FAS1) repeats
MFVRLLQRTRLVPTLINLSEFGDGRGLTILAPTDDAITRKMMAERQKRMQAEAANSLVNFGPRYVESDTPPLTQWEWAVLLAEADDDGDDSNKSPQRDDDQIVPIWTQEGPHLGNVNAVLRQQLLYHMLNFTLPYNINPEGSLGGDHFADAPPSLPAAGKTTMLTTLHLPSHRLLHEPTRPGPVPQPPRTAPHPGAEDEGGLLGGEGQKVRICTPDGAAVLVGTSTRCEGGAKITKVDRTSEKGILISIDKVLDLPADLATVIKEHPKLQHLLNMTNNDSLRSLTESAHVTFFLPTAESFKVLSTIERTFITGHWQLAVEERLKLLGMHMSGIGIGEGQVAYADRIRETGEASLTTIFGGQIHVQASPDSNELVIDGGKVIEEDILTENGVVHIVDKLLLPFGDLGLSVEKSLLALNASRFVSLMHAANLEHYIDVSPHGNDDPDEEVHPWTFMVPRDDAISTWWKDRMGEEEQSYFQTKWGVSMGGDEYEDLDKRPSLNGSRLVDVLKYHIAPELRSPQNLTDGMLIGTELRDWRLKDARQRIIVGVEDGSGGSAANRERQGNGDVGFGGANVIAEPVIVGPSIIYLISQILEPPHNPIQTAVSSLSLSTFVATVFSAELDKPIKRAPAVTYLVPHNDAFAALGLAMPYLLLDQEQPRREIRAMVEYHAIDQIVYMPDFITGSQRYPTLEGSDIWAGRSANGTVEVRRGTDGRNARVLKGDLLTSTGVLHEIDQVELPPTLDLTIGKLMKGAKTETMRDLIERAGYGWLLNGTRPTMEHVEEIEQGSLLRKFPDGKKKKRSKKRHNKRHQLFADQMQSYVVLCPTDAAFTRINLTQIYSDQEALKQLVQLHIIPSPADAVLPGGTDDQIPLSIRDAASFDTLLDAKVGGSSAYGKVAFRKLDDGDGSAGRQRKRFNPFAQDEQSDMGWMVGIADTRGTDGRRYAARLLSFGRESLSIERDHTADRPGPSVLLRKSHRAPPDGQWNSRSIGGVLTIDAVLQPYVPGWFYRWGWIVLTSFAVTLALGGLGYGVWVWYSRDGRIRLPDALDGEEE